jgi:hypothetical protein
MIFDYLIINANVVKFSTDQVNFKKNLQQSIKTAIFAGTIKKRLKY